LKSFSSAPSQVPGFGSPAGSYPRTKQCFTPSGFVNVMDASHWCPNSCPISSIPLSAYPGIPVYSASGSFGSTCRSPIFTAWRSRFEQNWALWFDSGRPMPWLVCFTGQPCCTFVRNDIGMVVNTKTASYWSGWF